MGPRGTLGTLLRTTLAQAGVVREVLERGAREGRARLDDVRRSRRRDDALVRLGEAVLEAVRAGDAQDLYDLPDVADALAELDGLDAGAEDFGDPDDRGAPDRGDRGERGGRERGGLASWVAPAIRDRFDRRPDRPPPIAPRETDDDGTVSSGVSSGGSGGASRRTGDEPGARFQERARPAAAPPTARDRVKPRPAPVAPAPAAAPPAPRKGGIQFAATDDDDEDLSQYMHPDDVPPKGRDDVD